MRRALRWWCRGRHSDQPKRRTSRMLRREFSAISSLGELEAGHYDGSSPPSSSKILSASSIAEGSDMTI